MAASTLAGESKSLTLLIATQGQWGERISENVCRFCPESWVANRWSAPPVLPPVVDDPEDFLPTELPQADLVVALGDTPGFAQLLPDIVPLVGAKSVIAPIDRNESLPPGLVAQLEGWLTDLGVTVVFPKPFCSLTETTYNLPPIVREYNDPLIRAFATHFGKPRFEVAVNQLGQIDSIQVERDAACGCARHIAAGLAHCRVEEAEYQAGMLHHHYPCLASMNQDPDYHDTLMHVSGHVVREALKVQLESHLGKSYLRPAGLVEENVSTRNKK